MAAISNTFVELWKEGTNLALPQFMKIITPGEYVDYSADVSSFGDTINLHQVSNREAATWNGSDALSYSALTAEEAVLSLNNYAYDAFSLGDGARVQSGLQNLIEKGTAKAAGAFGVKYDKAGIDALKVAGLAGSWDESFDSADISTGAKVYDLIVDAIAQLVDNGEDVENDPVRVAMSPAAYAKLQKGGFLGTGSEANANVIASGVVTNVAGATVVRHSYLTQTDEEIVVYKPSALAFAQQLLTAETLRDKDTPTTLFRDVRIYGIKVLRPTSVVCITEADDTD